MRLLCISDIHGRRDKLETILRREPPVDVVVLGGDLTRRGTPQDAAELLKLARDHAPRVLAVAGNSDSRAIDDYLLEAGAGLHGKVHRVDGVVFLGLSGVPRGLPWHYRWSEEEFDSILKEMAASVEADDRVVLVAHSPPKGVLDRTYLGTQAGSIAIRRWIEGVQPDLVICGHIHEAQGSASVGRSLVVNCGPGLKKHYAVVNLGPPIESRIEAVPYRK